MAATRSSSIFIGYSLMEGPFIAIRPVVEFQCFQFDTVLCWHVFKPDGGKVRLSSFGAEAGELGGFYPNNIVP